MLNDAYNANPGSMAAALRALALLPAGGGPPSSARWRSWARRAPPSTAASPTWPASSGFDLIAVGTPDYGLPPVAGIEEALIALGPLDGDDAVLVKASRVAGLERLVDQLMAGPTRRP